MYPDARQPQRGTSLIELVTLLAVAVIALGASVPLFSDVRAGMQLRGSMSHWMSSLALARTAALERGRNVVACPADGERCVASTFWHDGWILFEDRDRNGERSSDELLLLATPLNSDVRIASSGGRQYIRYRPDGSSEGSNVTLTFCDRRGPAKARTLVVSNAGRVRMGAATPAQTALTCAAG